MSTETTTFTIGAAATCADGPCGTVSRVVVDPVARAVTHLVVEPKHGHRTGRLVPVDRVDAATGEVRLRCTTAEFDELEAAEETQFLQESDGFAGYQPGQALSWPFYPMGGMSAAGMGIGRMGLDVPGSRLQELTYETIPLGEVDVHRGDHVRPPTATSVEFRGSSSTRATTT